jgi:hypothetical protein
VKNVLLFFTPTQRLLARLVLCSNGSALPLTARANGSALPLTARANGSALPLTARTHFESKPVSDKRVSFFRIPECLQGQMDFFE